jgi:hypothetical protein
MQIDAFFQKNKVWFFTAFSFLLSNTGIGSSRYAGTEKEDEAPSQQILLTKEKDRTSLRQARIRNTSRRRMYGRKILIKDEKKVPLQQIHNDLQPRNQTKVEISSRRGRVRNISRQSMNENMCIPGEDEASSQQMLLTKEKDRTSSQQIRIRNTSCQKNNRNKWTQEEDDRLLWKMSSPPKKPNGKPSWPKISESFPGRTRHQCAHRWNYTLNPGIRKRSWSQDEDRKLNNAVTFYINSLNLSLGKFRWKEIAKKIRGRTGKQCRNRWQCTFDSNIRKGPWDKEEDEILIQQVKNATADNNGLKQISWTNIAKSLNRTGAQCYMRWHYALDPNIKRGPWTDTETEELMEIVKNYIKEHGNRKINWQVIAQSLAKKTDEVDETNSTSHRTDRQCYSHWKYIFFALSRKPWTQDEDETLKEQMQNPPRDNRNRISWVQVVAESMSDRTPRECNERAKKLNLLITVAEEDIKTVETEIKMNKYQLVL